MSSVTSYLRTLCGLGSFATMILRKRCRLLCFAHDDVFSATQHCPFCNMTPDEIVYEDKEFVGFRDRNESGKVHFLVIPRCHIGSVFDLEPSRYELVRKMHDIGHLLLDKEGFTLQNRRLGFHVPPYTSVGHLHLHVIGLPFKDLVRSVKYSNANLAWINWFVDVEKVLQSLAKRDKNGTWTWDET